MTNHVVTRLEVLRDGEIHGFSGMNISLLPYTTAFKTILLELEELG